MPSKEEPQNFQHLYGFFAKINFVIKFLFLGLNMLSEKQDEVSRKSFI